MNIWIYWEQGWQSAPYKNKVCLQSWIKYNEKDWTINVIDKRDVQRLLDMDNLIPGFWSKQPIQSRADVVRINLLHKYGGVWVDSTTFCTKPLSAWLTKLDYELFWFERKDMKRSMMSNWFLAAPLRKDRYLIDTIVATFNKYWHTHDVSENYFQFHYICYDLYHTDPIFRLKWDCSNQHMNADGPHYVQRNRTVSEHVTGVRSPLYKLNSRTPVESKEKFLFDFHGVPQSGVFSETF